MSTVLLMSPADLLFTMATKNAVIVNAIAPNTHAIAICTTTVTTTTMGTITNAITTTSNMTSGMPTAIVTILLTDMKVGNDTINIVIAIDTNQLTNTTAVLTCSHDDANAYCSYEWRVCSYKPHGCYDRSM